MASTVWDRLDYQVVREHYDKRVAVHKELRRLVGSVDAPGYARLALGITDDYGNFSASEHGLGPKILSRTKPPQVQALGRQLDRCTDPKLVPGIISAAGIWNLKISVGSEMSAMLNPDRFWVTNVRTVWATLVIKHNDSVRKANQEVELYRDSDPDSEAAYAIWTDLHVKLDVSLVRVAKAGADEAKKQGVTPGKLQFLWADAIAGLLFGLRDDF